MRSKAACTAVASSTNKRSPAPGKHTHPCVLTCAASTRNAGEQINRQARRLNHRPLGCWTLCVLGKCLRLQTLQLTLRCNLRMLSMCVALHALHGTDYQICFCSSSVAFRCVLLHKWACAVHVHALVAMEMATSVSAALGIACWLTMVKFACLDFLQISIQLSCFCILLNKLKSLFSAITLRF